MMPTVMPRTSDEGRCSCTSRHLPLRGLRRQFHQRTAPDNDQRGSVLRHLLGDGAGGADHGDVALPHGRGQVGAQGAGRVRDNAQVRRGGEQVGADRRAAPAGDAAVGAGQQFLRHGGVDRITRIRGAGGGRRVAKLQAVFVARELVRHHDPGVGVEYGNKRPFGSHCPATYPPSGQRDKEDMDALDALRQDGGAIPQPGDADPLGVVVSAITYRYLLASSRCGSHRRRLAALR